MATGKKTGGRRKGTPNKATAEIRKYAQKYTKDALDGLAHIARTSESDSARVAAWNALLDRGHGRPAQSVAVGADKDSPLTLAVFHGVPPRINQHPAEKPIKLTENENGILEEKA